jgi:hypothetical protein
MEIRIVIPDTLLGRARRMFTRRRMVALAATVTLIGGAGIVYATSPTPPHSFTPNTVISSSQVNENFATIYGAVNAVELGTGLVDGAIATSKLADGSVTVNKLAANAVTAEKISGGAVTNVKLGADAVTSDKIANGTIATVDLGAGVVTSGNIAATAFAGSGSATTIARSDHAHGEVNHIRRGTTTSNSGTVAFSPAFPGTPVITLTPEFNGGGVACQLTARSTASFSYICGGTITRVHWIAVN